MANRVQLSAVVIAILLSEVNSVTIFKGLSIKKGFDISFIPFPIESIAFIKEKWTPFGSFGVKHGITRRQALDVVEPEVVVTPVPVVPPYIIPPVPRPEVIPVAPVVEHHEELPVENVDNVPPAVPLLTPPLPPVVENPAPEAPVPVVVEEPVAPNPPEAVPVEAPPVEPPVIITPVPHLPIPAAPIGPLVPQPVQQPVPTNLNTDISRTPAINNYLNSVEKPPAPVVPPVTEVKQPEIPFLFGLFPRGGLRNGSKLAIQLGSAFLHYMTQIFNSPQSPLARFAETVQLS